MPAVLSIVETSYRATIEEQDDTILWLNHMGKIAGLDVALLLRANAVNYVVRGQDATGLAFGAAKVAHPPALDSDVEALIARGVAVYYLVEDASERGIDPASLVEGATPVARSALPELFERFDQLWHW
jgi:sulfur relay (sulfurtransferase) DsrF/TusC family protein